VTDPISTPVSTITTGTGKPSAPTSKNQMDENTFLKLLVAQLKYQDPNNPTDPTQFISQTAQFTQVQTLEKVATQQQDMLTAQLVQTASGMVGRTVTYVGPNGTDVSGVVSSASITGGSPTLRVGGMDVPLSSVTKVSNPAG
jgi:flagellar basal-body rod modification protein FlgD